MQLKDILTSREIEEYNHEWQSFDRKYELETPYNVHSGMPVVGKPMKFREKQVFRAHVFQKRLRRFDPYFLATKYIQPFWHMLHYSLTAEQMYQASASMMKDNSKLHVKEIPESFQLRRPIFWDLDRVISIELILENLGESFGSLRERANFAFYEDRRNRVLGRLSAVTYCGTRIHIELIERIKRGDESAREELIKKILSQDIKHKKLLNPRKNIQTTAEQLVAELKAGRILEEDIHDFFSFWDKT